MPAKRLALTKDGKMTYCSATEETMGKGRCNHVTHQRDGESVDEFINRINSSIVEENSEIPDQHQFILKIVKEYGRCENPDWGQKIRDLPNPFVIGADDSYEEAEMVDFQQEEVKDPDGDKYHLIAKYKFRDKIYECDYGEVPKVQDDGTIMMNGVSWRVLPVVEQNKAGAVSYYNNVVFRKANGRDIAFSMPKDPDVDYVLINGKQVPIECVQNFLQNGDTNGLNTGQVYALSDLDPVIFERFPNMRENLAELKNLPTDECNDLQWRRCLRYEDIVQDQMRIQMRRMGTTFRTNLSKREKALESDPTLTEEDLNRKYPLFYQVNLTDNIKADLVSRSNVQAADTLNPIAALSQSQKISFTGPGGYNKDKAPHNLRMPHNSHEGLIDSLDVSAGHNIGLVGTLSQGTIDDRGFIVKKNPEDCLSPSDFIPYRNHNDPNRGMMAVAHMKQACPLVGGEDPIIKTPAWDKIKGAKLGVNLRVAYVTDPKSGTFEDSVIISQSAAEKMATIQTQKYQCDDTSNIKVGQRVERKDEFANAHIKVGGVVTEVTPDGFSVETYYKMGPGDKLAGRHGNKSTVAKVLPDSEMPKMLNEATGKYEPVQVLMSPASVAGRKNLGQVMECNESMGDGPSINKTRKIVTTDGHQVDSTGGIQYIHRLNHIAEKKLSSYADELDAHREAMGRIGEMESILLSQDEDRLKILDYLRHQQAYDSHNKLNHLLKAVGVEMTGVNWK